MPLTPFRKRFAHLGSCAFTCCLSVVVMGGCATKPAVRATTAHPSVSTQTTEPLPPAKSTVPAATIQLASTVLADEELPKPTSKNEMVEESVQSASDPDASSPEQLDDLLKKDQADPPSVQTSSLLTDVLSSAADGTASSGLALDLQEVIASVQGFFPMLEVAYLERERTTGNQIAAWGEFDTKLKGYTENQPLGFYENYQHGAGLNQPLYRGGEVYSGYRIGRGIFEPWYLERETNKGGEFKTGFELPLLRNRKIDSRRAELWRATYDRQLAEPAIAQEVIATIRDASITYWQWVAAGQQLRIGQAALELANRRNQQVARRVEEGDLGPPALQDNQVAIAKRQAKLIELQRKLIQSAVKLSLYLRDGEASPLIPEEDRLPRFPQIQRYQLEQLQDDIAYAIGNRPELTELDTLSRRLQVDLAEACNDTLANLDALGNVSQDIGEPTSSKRDKSELELELGLVFEMPVQRRKGLGKARAARAKLRQVAAKRQFTVEKITTEVQAAAAALDAAFERVDQNREAVDLAEKLARIERRKFELGESDLLAVFLREQIAIESASDLVAAQLDYFVAQAAYTAALAYQYPVFFDQLAR